ncbi:hypothetical protein QLX67_10080 [Balneolaceae bacterium ANBcel3]|nr:hypothetical protein [Balneolaceae bacterium ANBcel3]
MSQKTIIQLAFLSLIIGVASVIALHIFGANAERLNRDAVEKELQAAASIAQSVWVTPQALKGAGQDFEENMSRGQLMASLRIPGEVDLENAKVVNAHAEYHLEAVVTDGIQILAIPATWPGELRMVVKRNAETRSWETRMIE